MKVLVNKSNRGEKGQALILVLILMLIGGLIIAPLLSYMSSGIIVEETYEEIADEFYAADSGVADGLWQIKYNNLSELFSDYDPYEYYNTQGWEYDLAEQVNNTDVEVTINNVWIPKGITAPASTDAEQLIEAGKLMITGSVSAELTQQIKIYYYQEESDDDLQINKIGIWLPPGFHYDTESDCTLETWLEANDKNYSREITTHCGGEAVVWTLLDTVLFTELPEVETMDYPLTSTITFKFTTTQPDRSPEALSWITTSGVSDIPYTWDADVKVYHINSQAGGEDGTIVDAYAIKTGLRELGSTIFGDYCAIGNTLMVEGFGHGYNPSGIRYELLDESDAEASDIPTTAQVDAAYLYWSAWVVEGGNETLFFDNCANINNGNWYYGSDWHQQPYGGSAFYAHHNYYGGRELEMVNTVDLSLYGSEKVTVSWRNWLSDRNIESNDCFQYAFYKASGWSNWYTAFCDDYQVGTWPVTFSYTVPDEYLTGDFKIKFQILGFEGSGGGGGWPWGPPGGGGDETCYIDDITITAESATVADTSVIFKINGEQVYFEEDEFGNPTIPTEGYEPITADQWQVLENFTGSGDPHGFSYACFKDVSGLLQAFSDQGDGENRTGNGTYTLGDVNGDTGDEWSYAAWSLLIIYSSPETKGHQLYLYDDFVYSDMNCNVDFDGDGEEGGTISGFLVPDPIPGEVNAAQITCFVAEGDECYGDNPPDDIDCLIFNEHKLYNDVSPQNNVWNSKSPELEEDGIDIDTFYIAWDDGILEPGASSADIDLITGTDSWNLVYIILSFRSSTITGGTVTYLIKG